jgi:hypothetical protein
LYATITQQLSKRLVKPGKAPKRKAHKLTQFKECGGLSHEACYKKVETMLNTFFDMRDFMWPTFAGNGFDFLGK